MIPIWTDNIHQFDGKLQSELQRLPWHTLPTRDEEREYILENRERYTWTPLSDWFLKLIVMSPDGANYDPSNQVHALDLLYFCFQLLPNYHQELQEQLEEMATGSCPQGRCTRLWNVLFVVYGDTEEKEGSKGNNSLDEGSKDEGSKDEDSKKKENNLLEKCLEETI